MSTPSKVCRTCGIEKDPSEFNVNNKFQDGLNTECRICSRARAKRAYAADSPKARKRARQSYRAHPEKARAILRASRARNRDFQNAIRREERKLQKLGLSKEEVALAKEEFRRRYYEDSTFQAQSVFSSREAKHDTLPERRYEKRKLWEKQNEETLKAHRQIYYAANKERIAAVQREWRQSNPAPIANSRHARRAKTKDSNFTNEHLSWLHSWQDGRCFFCGKPNGDQHLDHVHCLDKGGKNENYNGVYACECCNTSKKNKWYALEWTPRAKVHKPRFYHAGFSKELAKRLGTSVEAGAIHYNGKTIFVLSTFAFSFPGHDTLPSFAEKHPGSIFIWDFEWKEKKNAVMNVLGSKLFLHAKKGARQLVPDLVDASEAAEFLDAWHMQGYRAASAHVGLRDGDGRLHAVASFVISKTTFELARFCVEGHVAGALSKLLAFFRRTFLYSGPITSYCDLRFGSGGAYTKTGFRWEGDTQGSYSYVNGEGIHHRLQFAPSNARERWPHYDDDFSEEENANARGYRKLIGLPQRRFVAA